MKRSLSIARIAAVAALGAVAVLSASTGQADVLHLASGGSVKVASWWVDDDVLYYRDARGTIGLPRASVVRIEKSRVAQPDSAAEPPVSSVAARRGARRGSPGKSYRVPLDVARRMDEAQRALSARDFEQAASIYESVLRDTEADFQAPRVGYAVAQIALGEDDLAHSIVLDALARDPQQPQFLELLGDILNRQERVVAARDTWREAFDLAPSDRLREKLLKAERELQAARDYDIAATAHYNLRYDGSVDDALAESVEAHLEEQYWIMADRFDHAPRQPITVVLYPQQDFRDVTQAAEWVGGIYDGKIKVPLGGLRRLSGPAAAVLTHELTHAFVHSKSRGQCPRWLHEGLAQRSTGQTLSPADRRHIVERVTSVHPAEWESRGFSYPIALSLTDHLEAQIGSRGLLRLLELMGGGADVETALREVHGAGYAELCRSWAEAVRGDS